MLNNIKKIVVLLGCSLICSYFLTGCKTDKVIVLDSLDIQELETQGEDLEEAPAEDAKEADIEPSICVYVCGAVNQPGVYYLENDSRVSDALYKAGGFSQEADTVTVNLAAFITDGQKLYFPTAQEVLEGYAEPGNEDSVEAGQSSSNSGKININTATKSELMQLPGIGDAKAQAIISFRDSNGYFGNISDIKNVSGIGDNLFNQIVGLITVE